MERYLINTEAPKYNTVHNNNNNFSFGIKDIEWSEFSFTKNEIKKTKN